jgi:hypothetical protein
MAKAKQPARDVAISGTFMVSKQFLSNILVGMAETCPEMTSWFGDENTKIERIAEDETWLEPLSVIRIVGRYDRAKDAEGARGGRAVIDMASVAIGLQRLITYASLSADLKGCILIAMAENDCGHIDSEACDVIAQLAIFGEVVYG